MYDEPDDETMESGGGAVLLAGRRAYWPDTGSHTGSHTGRQWPDDVRRCN